MASIHMAVHNIPVPGGLIPYSGLQEYCIHMVHTHLYRQNTHTHKTRVT